MRDAKLMMSKKKVKYAGVHFYCGFMYLERSMPKPFLYQKQP